MKPEMLNRKLTVATLLGLLLGLSIALPVSAQFMRTTIHVSGAIATEQIEPLAVSFAKTNDKMVASANTSALFSISGNDDVNVLVRVQSPGFLVSDNNEHVPFNMNFAWQNNGSRKLSEAVGSENNQASFHLRSNVPANAQSISNNRNAYLFLNGSADITHVNTRELSGDITLTIEFE